MTDRERKLSRAINSISKYYGQFTNLDTIRALAGGTSSVPAGTVSNDFNFVPMFDAQDDILAEIIALILDVSDGAYLTKDVVAKIKEKLGYASGEETAEITNLRESYKRFVTIYSDVADSPILPCASLYEKMKRTTVTQHGDSSAAAATVSSEGTGGTPICVIDGEFATNLNLNPNNPTKSQPNLSIILSHTSQLSLGNRFTTACSIFMNGMPGIEMSRAVPYLDVQIVAARPALLNDKLFAPSIYKFLLGGINAPNGSVVRELQTANSSSSPLIRNLNENYTIMGMEAFLSPQTLTPLNLQDQSIRATDVIDKNQPFMSINDFTVDAQAAYAANVFRTAKLSLTLHDRSRMSEIAELFRPDLIMGTQFMIDYGWIHPDGEMNNQTNNVYADIINGMRLKEKYRVVNWNFAFSDNGNVKVDLDLATVGESTFNQELIVNDGVNVGNSIRRISELVDRISELRRDIFDRESTTASPGSPGSSSTATAGTTRDGGRRREIRGIQFLDAAGDAFNNLTLTAEQNQNMREFMNYLSNANGIPNVSELRDSLIELYGSPSNGRSNRSSTTTTGGATSAVRNQIQQQIESKLSKLKKNEEDPFLVNEGLRPHPNNRSSGRVNRNAADASEGEVSLGNILANFIGLPAASSGQFDEVQMLFYPFNDYAGFANRINIASFRVDVAFFKTKYLEYRLSNLSRSGTLTLQQFWQFLVANILDDHGARSYGLFDNNGGLWKDPNSRARTTESGAPEEEEVYDSAMQTARLNCILQPVTPDGSFRVPQLQYFIETVPAKANLRDGDDQTLSNAEEKTILRIHILDQASDTRGSLGQILMAERNSALGLVPAPPGANTTSEYPNITNSSIYYSQIIEQAQASQLIESVGSGGNRTYRLRGGSKQLKRFLYTVMPSIIYGANGTLIKNANVTSLQDQAANSINIVNAPGRSGEGIEPNGEERGGLPLQIIPIEASITCMGCPLLSHGAQYYVDFGTGTTLDDIYMINGYSHKLSRGEFTTTFKLIPTTGFGTYRNYLTQLREASQALIEIETARNNGTTAENTAATNNIQNITSQLCNTTTRSRRERNAGHTGPHNRASSDDDSNNNGGSDAGLPAGAVSQDERGNYLDANGNIVPPVSTLTAQQLADERVREAQAVVDADRAAARQRREDQEVARTVEQREAGALNTLGRWIGVLPPRSAADDAAYRRARGLPTREAETSEASARSAERLSGPIPD